MLFVNFGWTIFFNYEGMYIFDGYYDDILIVCSIFFGLMLCSIFGILNQRRQDKEDIAKAQKIGGTIDERIEKFNKLAKEEEERRTCPKCKAKDVLQRYDEIIRSYPIGTHMEWDSLSRKEVLYNDISEEFYAIIKCNKCGHIVSKLGPYFRVLHEIA